MLKHIAMSSAPTAYSGVMHRSATRRLSWNSVESPPTIGLPSNDTAITTLEMPDARSRSATGVTSSNSAYDGPAGIAVSAVPRNSSGAATARRVVSNASASTPPPARYDQTVTCTRARSTPRASNRSAKNPPASRPTNAPAPMTGAIAPTSPPLRPNVRLKYDGPHTCSPVRKIWLTPIPIAARRHVLNAKTSRHASSPVRSG